MTHDLKVIASFWHQNVAVHIKSYPYTTFHNDIITPSWKTTLNLILNQNSNIKFHNENSKSMTHDLRFIASFWYQNVAVHITSYPYTRFYNDITTPSWKTSVNLLGRTDGRMDWRTDPQTEELYARPALQAGHNKLIRVIGVDCDFKKS